MASKPKVVLITGSSAGGIGGALCEEYARAGCIVYATARRLESMDALKTPAEGEIRKLKMDVNDEQSVQDAVKTILDKEGRIDVLVNNAGVLAVGPILDIPIDEVQSAFTTNLFSVIRLTQIVVPHMVSTHPNDETKGLVVNIGSITAIIPIPWGGIYATTKAALKSLTETMSLEFGPIGVKTMLVEPGGIRSNLSTNYNPTAYTQPPNSLYKAYLQRIIDRINISQTPTSMDTNEFARVVVKSSNLPSPTKPGAVWKPRRYLSIGPHAWTFYFMTWLPRWVGLADRKSVV